MIISIQQIKQKFGLYRVDLLGNQNILGATKPSHVVAPGTRRPKNKFRTLGDVTGIINFHCRLQTF